MNFKILAFLAFLILILISGIFAHATTTNYGGGSSTTDYMSYGQFTWGSTGITATQSGQLQSIGINVSLVNHPTSIYLAIYANNNSDNEPLSLLSNTSNTSITTTGWVDLPVGNTINIQAGKTYWIMVQVNQTTNWLYFYVNIDDVYFMNSQTYGTFPIFSGFITDNDDPNVRITYNTAITTTTSTSTSSISTTINALGLNQTSLGAVFAQNFNEIPYFGAGLIFLAFGIVLTRAKKLSLALFIAGIVSYLITGINPATITIASFVTALFIVIFIYEVFTTKKK